MVEGSREACVAAMTAGMVKAGGSKKNSSSTLATHTSPTTRQWRAHTNAGRAAVVGRLVGGEGEGWK